MAVAVVQVLVLGVLAALPFLVVERGPLGVAARRYPLAAVVPAWVTADQIQPAAQVVPVVGWDLREQPAEDLKTIPTEAKAAAPQETQ